MLTAETMTQSLAPDIGRCQLYGIRVQSLVYTSDWVQRHITEKNKKNLHFSELMNTSNCLVSIREYLLLTFHLLFVGLINSDKIGLHVQKSLFIKNLKKTNENIMRIAHLFI